MIHGRDKWSVNLPMYCDVSKSLKLCSSNKTSYTTLHSKGHFSLQPTMPFPFSMGKQRGTMAGLAMDGLHTSHTYMLLHSVEKLKWLAIVATLSKHACRLRSQHQKIALQIDSSQELGRVPIVPPLPHMA